MGHHTRYQPFNRPRVVMRSMPSVNKSRFFAFRIPIILVAGMLTYPKLGLSHQSNGAFRLSQLTSAEQMVVDAARNGTIASFEGDTDDDPRNGSKWRSERTIRAAVINDSLKGSKRDWKLSSNGLRIEGAKIIGIMDLSNTRIDVPLSIERSFVEEPVILSNASIRSLSFNGSYLAARVGPLIPDSADRRVGFAGDNLNVDGTVSLGRGFTAKGTTSLSGGKNYR
jgi:hypothetical protein